MGTIANMYIAKTFKIICENKSKNDVVKIHGEPKYDDNKKNNGYLRSFSCSVLS